MESQQNYNVTLLFFLSPSDSFIIFISMVWNHAIRNVHKTIRTQAHADYKRKLDRVYHVVVRNCRAFEPALPAMLGHMYQRKQFGRTSLFLFTDEAQRQKQYRAAIDIYKPLTTSPSPNLNRTHKD